MNQHFRTESKSITIANQDILEGNQYLHKIVTSILICNNDSSARTITLNFYDDSESSTIPMFSGYSVSANGVYHLVASSGTHLLSLDEGDIVKATSGTDNHIQLILNYIEEPAAMVS